ncbi:MAG: phosphomannomutase/phosphoglucomutase [Rudaea sp.]
MKEIAKKKSALELSQGGAPVLSGFGKLRQPHTALFVVACVLLIAGIFCLWQSWLKFRIYSGTGQIETVSQWEVQALGTFVAETRKRISTAVNDDTVTAPLQQGGEGAIDAATNALQKLLPDLVSADFYKADLSDVLKVDFAEFGYAKAAMLVRAHELNLGAPLQSHRKANKQRVLAFALPAVRAKDAVAFAYVELPFEPMLKIFRQPQVSNVRLDLRQGDGRGDLVLDSIGAVDSPNSLNDAGLPIGSSVFRIGAEAQPFPIFIPGNVWVTFPAAIVLLLAGVFFLHARRVGLKSALVTFSRRPAPTGMSDTTLAESMAQAPKTAMPVAAKTKPALIAPIEVDLDASIFRAYDIRGVLGKTLTQGVARQIGRAIGSEARDRGLNEIAVARDGRLSGPDLSAALIEGLQSTGCTVIDIGAAPTPVLYFATYHLNIGSGVMVTGSHNPPDYNGFKIVLGGETLAEAAIKNLYTRIKENRFTEGSGALQKMDVTRDYIERITGDVMIEHKLKVVVDCGNGIAGAVAPSVLEGIGCEVLPMYCDVDGNFPNHHPDPSDPRNLQDLILSVKQMNADLGLAFDGDGDRLGVVTASGEVIYADRLLMLFARDVLTRNPGATIIYDVKCTGKLQPLILQAGGSPIMWKTGHSLIKAKMRETDAELAGEMSGHFFFRERWYGFDDGIYAAARLTEILAADPEGRTPQQIFDTLPNGVSTPELKIPMAEGANYAFIEKFQKSAAFDGARVTTIDGVRADWSDGWGLVRASNTTPVLVLRFDADNDAALMRIQDAFRQQLKALGPELTLPF